MRRQPREIELKFQLEPESVSALLHHPALKTAKKPADVEEQASTYFDTDRLDLKKADILLRVRRTGKKRIQTVKLGNGTGLFARGEWERIITSDEPDFSAAKHTPLSRVLDSKVRRRLRPVFQTLIQRRRYRLMENGSSIEAAVDQGQVTTDAGSLPLCELELELKQGRVKDLFRAARNIGRSIPMTLATKSKSARGYDLLAGTDGRSAAKTAEFALNKRARTGAAFQAIARRCLQQIVENVPAVSRGNGDALHQMRIGLRRLRTAISLLSEMLADTKREFIKAELKWASAELSRARDIDVFESEVGTHANGTDGDDLSGVDRLRRALKVKREGAFHQAGEVVRSARFRNLLLETSEWIETGDWITSKHKRCRELRDMPIRKFARKELARRYKKVLKRGKGLERLNEAQRHKLRIAGKKLRYAVEFFKTLFSKKPQTRRSDRLLKSLKTFQDALGALNDIRVRELLARDISQYSEAGEDEAAAREAAFAAGVLLGIEKAGVPKRLAEADAAYSRLRRAKVPWRRS